MLNDGSATGTTGLIVNVVGTLVCNAGMPQQAVLDTPAVPPSPLGNAGFSGTFHLLFLIRIPRIGKRCVAAGAVPVTSSISTDY